MRTQSGQPLWWPDHSAKLASDCKALALDCPDSTLLHAEVRQVAETGQGIVKIMLTRGGGARGYAPSVAGDCTRIVLSTPLPPHARSDAPSDITVRWCTLCLGRQPRLAGIKHMNRLENVLARAEWDDPAIFEGILCDDSGRVVSGVMSNLFWVKQGELFTPDLSECGVAGVARARLLRAAARLGIRCHIGQFRPDAILAADEVMICNSVIGVRRVARLDDMTWSPAGWTTTFNKALYEDLD
jgi:4-amino-4-deoxychorismate lyase